MIIAALSAFVFLCGLILLAYNGHVEDYGSPPLHTLVTAIPALIAGVLLMGVAVWRVGPGGLRTAALRLMVGTLAGLVAFGIGLAVVYS
jgi:hypothetical protein